MEKILKKPARNRIRIRTQDIKVLLLSSVLSLLPFQIGWLFLFPYITYIYMRNKKEWWITIGTCLCISSLYHLENVYYYGLGILSFYLIMCVLKIKNQNIYQWMPYIGVFLCIPYAYHIYGFTSTFLFIIGFLWLFYEELLKSYEWVDSTYILGKEMFAFILCALAMLIHIYAFEYSFYAQMMMLCFIALLTNVKLTFLCGFMFYFLNDFSIMWIIYYCVMSLYQGQKMGLLFITLLFGWEYVNDFVGLMFLAGLAVIFTFEQEKENTLIEMNPVRIKYENGVLKRQIQNFSYIFDVLSDYYKKISIVESEVLSSMSEALKYSVQELEQFEQKEEDGKVVLEALESHQFDVIDLDVDEYVQGQNSYIMSLFKIKESEVKSTILPLMEHVLHRKIDVIQVKKRHRFSRIYEIELRDQGGFDFDAYADSLKNRYESSGDCFSIFRFQDYVLCTISDGMGNGEKAAASSRLITNIFQRMIVSGFRQETSIQCINKLIQSDHFATLDVLCFHKKEGVAYLSKAAACPTFLIRDEHVYQINGNSLPVGIVSKIKPDCFKVALRENDEYLMVSDGILMEEVKEWLYTRRKTSAKKDVEQFREILQRKKREDDSTVVFAKVQKQ